MPKLKKIAHFTITALTVALVGTALCREVIVIAESEPDSAARIPADTTTARSSDNASPATQAEVPPGD